MTVMLLIDVSGSNLFGTRKQFKTDLITEIAAVLSFSAIYNNDKVGVIFFSNEVEKFIPPAKGKSHILRIIRELLTYTPSQKPTDISEALRYFTNAIKKKCTAFLISDFVAENFEQALKIAANRHDLVALHRLQPMQSALSATHSHSRTDANGERLRGEVEARDFVIQDFRVPAICH